MNAFDRYITRLNHILNDCSDRGFIIGAMAWFAYMSALLIGSIVAISWVLITGLFKFTTVIVFGIIKKIKGLVGV